MGWITQDIAGTPVPFYKQDQKSSCALACIAMAIKATGGGSPTERAIMNIFTSAPRADVNAWTGRPEGAYEPDNADRVSPLLSATYVGTMPKAVVSYLEAYRIKSVYNAAGDRDWDVLDGATLTKPVIVKGMGSTVNAHFITCFGLRRNVEQGLPSNNEDLIICDPDLGGVRLGNYVSRFDARRLTYPTTQGANARLFVVASHIVVT